MTAERADDRRLLHALARVADLVLVVDRAGVITVAGPSTPAAFGFSVDEAIRSATAGAAAALGLTGVVGTLAPGASADLVAWDAEHEGDFALRVGAVRPRWVWFAGERRSICHDWI